MKSSATLTNLFVAFQDRMKAAHRRLAQYIEREDEASIHDVRTSIRRLRAAWSVLPTSMKTSESRHYIDEWKGFFRFMSRPRDYDVIRARLLGRIVVEEDSLFEVLSAAREAKLHSAREHARRLSEMPRPRLKLKDDAVDSEYCRRVEKLFDEVQRYLPVVLADSSSHSEVHALRKAAKKLFYVLELEPGMAGDEKMSLLKKIQKLSGEICDSDVTVEFLNESSNSGAEFEVLLQEEIEQRGRNATALCDFLKSIDRRLLQVR